MSVAAATAQGLSAASGVFTAAQVERGQTAYAEQCARCHGDDLDAVDPEAPDLTGFSFRRQWVGQTVGARFDKIKATMPAGNAGGLDDQTYLDIIAFILSSNGHPAGTTELTPAVDLAAIQIAAP
jgi:cytochrome c553